MPEEGTRRISITYRKGRVSPSDVAGRSFASARKGFDTEEVRNFLELVSRELEDVHQREAELQEALSDAEHRANNPTIDEATLTTALGNETAKVLRTAHEVAAEIISKAETDAQRTREEAASRSDQIREQAEKYAEETRTQADSEMAALLDKANEEVLARVENARLEGDSMIAQSKSECMAMVKEAQGMKERILTDLSKKRSILTDQVAKLKEARDRTAQAVWRARHEIEKMSAEILPANSDGYKMSGIDDMELEKTSGLDDADRIGGYRGSPEGSREHEEASETAPGGRQAVTNLDEEEMISELGQVVEGSRTQLVDEIFARLRAGGPVVEVEPASVVIGQSSDPSVQVATEVQLEDEGPGIRSEIESEAEPDISRGRAEPVTSTEAEVQAELEVTDAPMTAAEAEVQSKAATAPKVESGKAAEGESSSLLVHDDTINDLSAGLAKRTKKILQDYQNELLERIRREKGWDDSMLPTAGRYIDDLEAAALTFARHAARQGAISVYEGNPDIGRDEEQTDDAHIDELLAASTELNDLARATAGAVIEGLSDRILEGSMDIASADVDSLVDHVGAAYREWKGGRIDSIADDQIRSAYSTGQLLVGDKLGLLFRWMSRNSSEGCPDCDDNALSDPIRSGEKFPTGHLHPPVHTGCHCLLIPAGQ
jgi:DivIVA domain-containing protein